MDTGDTLPPEALQAFAQSFGVAPEAALAEADAPTLDDVRRFLIPQITALLDRNPNLLMHILYRVDVAEREVKRAFAEASSHDLPGRLADLLIARQLQKLTLRRRYREKED